MYGSDMYSWGFGELDPILEIRWCVSANMQKLVRSRSDMQIESCSGSRGGRGQVRSLHSPMHI
jgi:hypothetical protein